MKRYLRMVNFLIFVGIAIIAVFYVIDSSRSHGTFLFDHLGLWQIIFLVVVVIAFAITTGLPRDKNPKVLPAVILWIIATIFLFVFGAPYLSCGAVGIAIALFLIGRMRTEY